MSHQGMLSDHCYESAIIPVCRRKLQSQFAVVSTRRNVSGPREKDRHHISDVANIGEINTNKLHSTAI
jgi:hypothetical protein